MNPITWIYHKVVDLLLTFKILAAWCILISKCLKPENMNLWPESHIKRYSLWAFTPSPTSIYSKSMYLATWVMVKSSKPVSQIQIQLSGKSQYTVLLGFGTVSCTSNTEQRTIYHYNGGQSLLLSVRKAGEIKIIIPLTLIKQFLCFTLYPGKLSVCTGPSNVVNSFIWK